MARKKAERLLLSRRSRNRPVWRTSGSCTTRWMPVTTIRPRGSSLTWVLAARPRQASLTRGRFTQLRWRPGPMVVSPLPTRATEITKTTGRTNSNVRDGIFVWSGPERRAVTMYLLRRIATSIAVLFCVASLAYGAEVNGTVKGPDGAPFEGAFVQARNAKTKITVSVLSRKGGDYRIPSLPAGEYELRIRAVGYQAQPPTGVSLAADQSVSYEFALQKGKVHWTDISLYQADQLLPA